MSTPTTNTASPLGGAATTANEGNSSAESKQQNRRLPNIRSQSVSSAAPVPPFRGRKNSDPTEPTKQHLSDNQLSATYSGACTPSHSSSTTDDTAPTAAEKNEALIFQRQIVSTQPGPKAAANVGDVSRLCDDMHHRLSLRDATETTKERGVLQDATASSSQARLTENASDHVKLQYQHKAVYNNSDTQTTSHQEKQDKVGADQPTGGMSVKQESARHSASPQYQGMIIIFHLRNVEGCDFEQLGTRYFPYAINKWKWILLNKSRKLHSLPQFQDGISIGVEEKLITVSTKHIFKEHDADKWMTECVQQIVMCLEEIETAIVDGRDAQEIAKTVSEKNSNDNSIHIMNPGKNCIELYAIDSSRMDAILKQIENILKGDTCRLLLKVQVRHTEFEMLTWLGFKEHVLTLEIGRHFKLHLDHEEHSFVLESTVDYRKELKNLMHSFIQQQASIPLRVTDVEKKLLFDGRYCLLHRLKELHARCWWKEEDGKVVLLASSDQVAVDIAKVLQCHLMKVFCVTRDQCVWKALENLQRSNYFGLFAFGVTEDGQKFQVAAVADVAQNLEKYLRDSSKPLEQEHRYTQPPTEVSPTIYVEMKERTAPFEGPHKTQPGVAVVTAHTTINPSTTETDPPEEPPENTSGSSTRRGMVPAKAQTKPVSRKIDDLVAHLLKFPKNSKEFKLQLYDKKWHAEIKSSPRGSFLHVTEGEPSGVLEVIKKLFHTKKFESDIDDEEFQKELKNFQSKHSESMAYCFESGTWLICFTADISEYVSEKLQEWKRSHHSVVLPLYAYDFILLKQKDTTKWLKEQVHPSVELQYLKVEQNAASAALSGDRGNTRKAVDCLQKLVLGLETAEENIDIHQAVSLQGVKHQCVLKEMETEDNCRIDIQQKGKSTMSWMSPKGHLVQVCENSMATTDCSVMVLPLRDEQKQWPPLHQLLLRKSFLSDDLQTYHEAVGKETPLLLQCNKGFADQMIAVVSVPAKWDDGQSKERERIMKAYQQIFSACKGDQMSVAVLARQSPNMELVKPLKAIMRTIFDTFSDADSGFRSVVIYTDSPQETKEVCCIVNDGLPKGWTSRPGRVWRPVLRKRMIETEIGEIQNTLADVIVNSTGQDLKVEKGAVENAIHRAAGQELRLQCEKTYPDGIPACGVAITDSFNIKNTKRIYHVALSRDSFTAAGPEKSATLLHDLSKVMYGCLLQASWENHRSIAFPTLGSGQLSYPCDVVARTMFSTTNKFFREMPNSSLEKVIIVIFTENREAIQAFKKEEISHLYTFSDDGGLKDKHGLVMKLGNHIIQAVYGNADQKPCVAECCIRGQQASDKFQKMDQNKGGKKETIILEKFSAGEYKSALQTALDRADVTVQVIAHTLRFQNFTMQDFVRELEGLLERKKKGKLVSVIFADKEKVGQFSNCFRAVETGHIDISENQLKLGQIHICAPALGRIMDKVKSLPVLPRLKQSAFLQELEDQRSDEGREVHSRSETQKSEIRAKGDEVSHTEGLVGDLKRVLNDLLEENKCTQEALCQALTEVRENLERKPSAKQKIVDNEKEAKLEEKTSLSRELDKLTVEALRYLMGDEFEQSFDVQESKGSFSVSLKGASSHDIMSKIDSLRREDVPLSSSEITKMGDVDVRKEGIEAFIRAVPDQSKAAIFAFDYNAITKAKHLVAVKAGRVKVTARARRRFDPASSGQEGTENQSPPQSLDLGSLQWGSGVGTADFVTSSGIKVSVYKTDITKLPVDAIVNAANEHLAHGGGVAAAIAKAAGYTLEEDGEEYIRKHGPLKVSEVAVTTGGSLPCQKVLHAVGPRWDVYGDKEKCQQDLVDTVYNCLAKTDTLGLHSLAIPSISSAIFGVPQKVCAGSYLAAVKKFNNQCGKGTSLKHIHFVDVSDAMVTIIQDTFRNQWNMPMHDLGALHFHPSSAPDAKTEAARSISSPRRSADRATNPTTVATRFEENTTQAPVPPPPSKESRHSDPVGAPLLKVVGEKKDRQYEFHFKDLNLVLIFQNGSVTDVQAEAYIFWQDVQNPLKDAPFKHFEKKMSIQTKNKLSDLKKQLVQEETVHSLEDVSRLLVFAVYSAQSFCEKGKAKKLVLSALNKVEMEKRSSVAVPRLGKKQKDKKEGNKDLDSFVMGLYQAVKEYSTRPKRSITRIYVLDTDQNTLKIMIYAVSDLIAKERSLLDEKRSSPPFGICVICCEEPVQPRTLSCSHTFCCHCIETWLKVKRTCPSCGCIQGILYGDQPTHGTMKMTYLTSHLPGFEDVGSYMITYIFMDGQQAEMHPQPGRFLKGTCRIAYLPDTEQGRTVLMLLKIAFDRCLIFTVGVSSTTGDVGITWNDIHHKTKMIGGSQNYGYPDPSYLTRVQKELESKGVTKKDFSQFHTDFIQYPHKHRSSSDFSKCFCTVETSV